MTNIISIEQVDKTFGERCILRGASFGIQDADKIGIIGINGTGKSTLLKLIAGLEEPDAGQIIRRRNLRIAYLPQNPDFPADDTILNYVLSGAKAQPAEESEAKAILNRLGFSNYSAKLAHLSGGQKKRAALAKTLLQPADLLILDEPTNHIDHEMAAWLESYLQKYKGAILMVTHDRYFLDRVTNQILEVSHGSLYGYAGGYETFLKLKMQREQMEAASARKRQSLLRMEEEWAMRGARARSTKQKARLERLEALRGTTDPATDSKVQLSSTHTRMGKKTIELTDVSKGFDGRPLFHDFNYTVLRGQRLGIIGPNGCGKTTLMKIIAGVLPPDAGCIEWGDTLQIGYFAQEEEAMDPAQRVIDYVRDIAEYIPTQDGMMSASQFLEQFLFDAALQYTPIGRLSGGERRRLYLLKVLASGANVLLLDEPTNDLDIPTLTILEEFLNSFSGIVITVSHDRYFLDAVVDRIFAFEPDGNLRQYEGGYSDYAQCKAREENQKAPADASSKKSTGQGWKQSRPNKLKFTFQEAAEYQHIDEEIAALEDQLEQINQKMDASASDYLKLTELNTEKERLEAALEAKMDRWVYLNDLAEQIAAQQSS